MAMTNSRTKEPKGRTALLNLFADILCFEAHPFRYFPEATFDGVVGRVFLIIPTAQRCGKHSLPGSWHLFLLVILISELSKIHEICFHLIWKQVELSRNWLASVRCKGDYGNLASALHKQQGGCLSLQEAIIRAHPKMFGAPDVCWGCD